MPLALLADRDVDSRQMYAEFLRLDAYEIDEAEDGREALVMARTRRPDVLVTETRLPYLSGLELCRLLRRDEQTRTLPIIILTADAMKRDVRLAEAAGADKVLIKPCLPEQLSEQISALLAYSSQLRERGTALRGHLHRQVEPANELVERSAANIRGRRNRSFIRGMTTQPAVPPPDLPCPKCGRPLAYEKSHLVGVNEGDAEQWDYYKCFPCGCAFEYRHRTRKVRQLG
jgi:CheY-like chemotaxis protein